MCWDSACGVRGGRGGGKDKDQCHVTSHKEIHTIKTPGITYYTELFNVELAARGR